MRLFIFGDADRVRDHVERYMLEGQFEQASKFARNLTRAVQALAEEVEHSLGASTILAGGDDVYFTVPQDRYEPEILSEIATRFKASASCSMSFGVGSTIERAYVNLRRAKSTGGHRIVDVGLDV